MIKQRSSKTWALMSILFSFALLAAACSSDDDPANESTAATEAAVDESTVTTEADEPDAETTEGSTVEAPTGAAGVLLEAMGRTDGDELGGGTTWNVGATLSFSGPGAASAEFEKNGIDLAVAHIAAAGGPEIVVEYGDNTTGGDPDAAANANINLNDKGIGVKLSDFADGLGAGFPTIAEFQILTIDAAAATGTGPGVGFDLYWGSRALTPFDGFPGIMSYIEATNPDATTMAVISNDAGPANESNLVYFEAQAASVGLEVAFIELVPFGPADLGPAIAKLQAEQPDAIVLDLHFGAEGAFFRQAINAGLDPATIFSNDLGTAAFATSQGALDEAPFIFAGDYAVTKQDNPLMDMVREEFEATYGAPLDDQAARYYQATLMLWELYMRTLANGGDVNSGPDLQTSLVENPNFVTLWGGSPDGAETFELDVEKHWAKGYPLGVYSYQGGETTTLATYDISIDGEGIRTAANFELS